MAKAKAAGSFIGALFNNPTFLILGALGIALLFFQKDIRNAFASIGEGFGKIELPEISLPTINLPEINFPEFPAFPDFSGFFTGLQESQSNFFDNLLKGFTGGEIPKPLKMVEDTGLLTQEEVLACQCGSTITQDAFGNVQQLCKVCDNAVDAALPSQDPALNIPLTEGFVGGIGGGLLDFLGLTPAQQFVQDKIETEDLPEGFTGGGISFIGGQINPTPIQNLSLSQIIDKFNVTASQAANIKAIASDDFGDFDFGTNLGLGLGSVVAEGEFMFRPPQFETNISNPEFQGLTPEEIALRLTGGNIQNF